MAKQPSIPNASASVAAFYECIKERIDELRTLGWSDGEIVEAIYSMFDQLVAEGMLRPVPGKPGTYTKAYRQ